MINKEDISAKVLAQLSIMQTYIIGIANTPVSLSFIEKGIGDIPGVSEVSIKTEVQANAELLGTVCFPIKRKGSYYATVVISVFNQEVFDIYKPYIENFFNTVAIIFEENKQKKLNKKLLEDLQAKNYALKESNEESAMLNEELTAANEELSASNEELNAVNEELYNKKQAIDEAYLKLKKAQEQLIQSEKMASIGVLASGVAHEINNPLNFISGGINIIEQKLKEASPESYTLITKELGFIREGIERASGIVKSLNHFNRQKNISRGYCNIHALIDNCLLLLHYNLKDRVSISKNYTSTNYVLHANEETMHQVILNLLGNAEQSITGTGEIAISTEVKDNKIFIMIADSGSGIPEEYLNRVFDPFFTTKPPGKGTGLGLSTAYQTVKEHGGDILLKSSLKGTIVTVTLPLETNTPTV